MLCSVNGCGKNKWARGLCSGHYSAARGRGDFTDKECKQAGCDRKINNRGYCNTHFKQARKRGEFPEFPKCIGPKCSNYSISGELCEVHYAQKRAGNPLVPLRGKTPGEWGKWTLNAGGYVMRQRRVGGRLEGQLQHRFVMEQAIGRRLMGKENVHHKNGNRADNRLVNLELWNTIQPKGQRIEDKVAYAKEILALYEPDSLLN